MSRKIGVREGATVEFHELARWLLLSGVVLGDPVELVRNPSFSLILMELISMYSFTKWIIAPVIAIGFTLAGDAPDAAAQYGCGYGSGYGIGYSSGYGVGYRGIRYGGVGISIGVGNYGGYRSPYHVGYSRTYYGRRPYHHSPTYLDRHRTEVIRHRNHYHVRPGHWDVYRGGHWHH
ncbi:MAG: hypothetical protein ACPGLY_18250 [Rubripirellula sp.]